MRTKLTRSRGRTLGPCLVACTLALSACGDSEALPTTTTLPELKPAAPTAGSAPAAAATAAAPEVLRPLRDSDFVESDANRDPFRNFAIELKGKTAVVAQRTVLMPTTPLKAMRLIAIITGIDQPRAMIVDERGVGHVTSRGDFVGQADVVQTGGAENLPVALNWRVDRIRENEVVLAREDPTGPNRPPLIQVIPLHPADEADQNAIAGARGDEG
ncbi:MAG: hypothetical protein QM778_07520 [Myxococcales bacterium]